MNIQSINKFRLWGLTEIKGTVWIYETGNDIIVHRCPILQRCENIYQAHTQHSLWAWGVLGCMNISFKSITQYWLTFLLSIKFYLWHYFVYWLQQLQNNRLPPPNGLNDVPEAVALLYPEGTYWLLYKLLSAYII